MRLPKPSPPTAHRDRRPLADRPVRSRRPESAADRFAPVDGLRAISALWTISFHVIYFAGYFVSAENYQALIRSPLLIPFAHGSLGVDVFFVISGYLIGSMLLREQEQSGTIRLGRFYLRRAFRILPPYIVTLILGRLVLGDRANLENAWANILFINNFLPIAQQSLGWLWSLAIEEQFYLLFPLILLLSSRWPSRDSGRLNATPRSAAGSWLPWLGGCLGVAVGIRAAVVLGLKIQYPNPFHAEFDPQVYQRYFDQVYDKPYCRYGSIVCGLIVAYLARAQVALHFVKRHLFPARVLLAGCLLGIAVLITRPGGLALADRAGSGRFALVAEPYGFALLVAYALFYTRARAQAGGPSRLGWMLSWPGWRTLATFSYGAYLLHPLVILPIWALWFQRPRDGLSIAAVVAVTGLVQILTFGLAYLLFITVERPCQKWGRRLAVASAAARS